MNSIGLMDIIKAVSPVVKAPTEYLDCKKSLSCSILKVKQNSIVKARLFSIVEKQKN
jgi:hypothetical protein